ncbi:hypothetical protein BDV97DRAFT_372157 [Delphinella strobiligena]|nr:hypothetical protein BDV97DRAFT_372157 [Delphinella strobiligena]
MTPIPALLASVALLCASLTIALPSPIHPRLTNTTGAPTSAPVTWYQESTAMSCGLKVSEGTIVADQCYTLFAAGLGIQQDLNHDCVFKVWSGVKDCSGNGTWTATAIPSGNGTTCIYDAVLDGGDFQHKSGIYSCT